MASNNKNCANQKKSLSRKWTEEELELYAIILSSEKKFLALKKSSNNEIFQHIKKILDGALKDKDYKNENEKQNFKSKDGRVLKYEPLDTSVLKLRKKYANLKTEWRKISDRAKTGSGFEPRCLRSFLVPSIPVAAKAANNTSLVSSSSSQFRFLEKHLSSISSSSSIFLFLLVKKPLNASVPVTTS